MGTEKSGLLGKYREIVVAVAFFLVFDLGVLILNFYTSYQIAEDAVEINLAGRQRMLSQRMTKSLMMLQDDLDAGMTLDRVRPVLDELDAAVKTFDATLAGFARGGLTPGGSGQMVLLKPVETARGQAIVASAGELWASYRDAMQGVLSKAQPSGAEVTAAVLYGRANNVTLLGLMNDLTSELEAVAFNKASWLRQVQTIGILLALLNFVFILFKFIRQLSASDRKAEVAQQETREILDTVREGLFLLDKEMRVGSQRSGSMQGILQRDLAQGTEFLPVLQEMVSPVVYDAARGYIELLFGNRVKERLVASLNPLSEVEVKLPDAQGNLETRYLSFQFNRVVKNQEVPHLLVTVQDVTERVDLVRQLLAAKSEARLEVNVLLRMLATDPAVLRNFLGNMETSLWRINDMLREASERSLGSAHDTQYVVNQAFRIVHACKGEAAALGLDMLETEAHTFEVALLDLRERGDASGDDLVALSVQLNGMFERVSMVREITEQLAGVSRGTSVASSVESGLESLAARIARSQSKEVNVRTELAALDGLPDPIATEVRQIAIQLLRNAVTHGIEQPDERLQRDKPASGQIHVACQSLAKGGYQLVLRDDGRGLDPERIRVALVAAGDCSIDEVKQMTDRELVMRIFDPGFTTAPSADRDAGHGVGMDVVLEKVRALGGRLHLSTRPNEYTEFTIHFPGFSA